MPSLVAHPPGVSNYSKSGSGSRPGTARAGRPGPHAGRPVTREGLAGHQFVTFALENVTRRACRDFAHDRTHVSWAQRSNGTMFSLAGALRRRLRSLRPWRARWSPRVPPRSFCNSLRGPGGNMYSSVTNAAEGPHDHHDHWTGRPEAH